MEGLLLAVAAVIVTYNSSAVIDACLSALRRCAPEAQIVVVDNASSDDTIPRASREAAAHCIANTSNVGFAAAVNQGARVADADFTLILNPDVELATPLGPLVDACRVYGIAAGQLTDSSCNPQAGFTIRRLPTPASMIFETLGVNRLWKSNPVNQNYRYLDRDLQVAGSVEQPAGAFLMVRRDVWERLQGFDEMFYPVWFEDVDFCRRAVDSGSRIEYLPSVTARHQGGHSVGALSGRCRATYWYVSLLRYASKHFQANQYRGVCLAVLLGSVARGLAGIVRERNLEFLTTHIGIARAAVQRMTSVPRERTAGSGD